MQVIYFLIFLQSYIIEKKPTKTNKKVLFGKQFLYIMIINM